MTLPPDGESSRPIKYTSIPGQYLEASVSDVIEMAAITESIFQRTAIRDKIKAKGLPFPGQAPLADTWGNLTFLRSLPGVSSRLTEKCRLKLLAAMRQHQCASRFGGIFHIWMDNIYINSLSFNVVGEMSAHVEVLHGFPSPR